MPATPGPVFTELSQFRIHPPSVRRLGYGFCLHNHVVVLGNATADLDAPGRAQPLGTALRAVWE